MNKLFIILVALLSLVGCSGKSAEDKAPASYRFTVVGRADIDSCYLYQKSVDIIIDNKTGVKYMIGGSGHRAVMCRLWEKESAK